MTDALKRDRPQRVIALARLAGASRLETPMRQLVRHLTGWRSGLRSVAWSRPSAFGGAIRGLWGGRVWLALVAMLPIVAACHDAAPAPVCLAGTEACPCAEGRLCDPGLACEEGLCVVAPGPADSAIADVSRVDLSTHDAPVAGDAGADTASASCTGDPVGDFCPCREGADCASGYCLPGRDGGRVCTRTCDGTCPDGLACVFVTLPNLDPTYLCVDPALNLCRPCTDDIECQRDAIASTGARCVRYGAAEGSFCGTACGTDADCPDAYACREVAAFETGSLIWQCVLADPDATCACSGRSVEGSAFTTCTVDRCEGTRLCGEAGLTGCLDGDGTPCVPSVAVTVGFDAQGGEITGDGVRTVYLGERYGALPEASREGYDLGSWRTAPGGGGESVTADTQVTTREAHTLFAAWRGRRYVVTFEAAGGSACEPRVVTFGTAYAADGALCTSTRPGYGFLGWRHGEGATGEVVSDATMVATARNHTLTATWAASVVTVSFDSEGGSACDSRSATFGGAYGAAGPLCAPSRPGFVFAGWFDGDNGTGNLVTALSTVGVTTNHVLHARWTAATCVVIFDAAGGQPPVPSSRTVTFGAAYGQLATTARDGYSFGGWWTAPDGGAEVTAPSVVSQTADHTLFARWTGNRYTLRFDSGGGSACDAVQVTFGDPYGDLCQPTRTGFTFEGWGVGAESSIVTPDTTVAIANTHTFSARWRANRYTVVFDSDGGSACPDHPVTFGEPYGPLCAPTRPGYTFGGWWGAQGGGGDPVTADTRVTLAASHELHARWVPNGYVVNCDSEGGTPCVDLAVTFGAAYGASVGGQICAPTRLGYTFGGWFLGDGGTGEGVTATTLVATANNHTIHARWTANTYVVTLDTEGGSACAPLSVTFGAAYGALCTPSRTGYAFGGWRSGDDGTGEVVTTATGVMTASNHAIHAA